jgi:hypothetical protein
MSDQHHATDRSAAFTGLILGALALGLLLYGIVRLTNARYAAEAGAKKTASATR